MEVLTLSVRNPSSPQATSPSVLSHDVLQMRPHLPLKSISTLPSPLVLPPNRRILPSGRTVCVCERERELCIHRIAENFCQGNFPKGCCDVIWKKFARFIFTHASKVLVSFNEQLGRSCKRKHGSWRLKIIRDFRHCCLLSITSSKVRGPAVVSRASETSPRHS